MSTTPLSPAWFARLSPLGRVGAIFAVVAVLCCGGAAGFAALLPGGDDPADKPAALVEPALTQDATDARTEPTTQPTTKAAPPSTTRPATTPKPAPTRSYANCAAVKAAGKAPLRRGQPGYRTALDADRDGIACESATRAKGGDAPNPKPTTTKPKPTTDPRFDTCAEAKSHGYGPYDRGDTEYGWYRDADNDGRVCE